jgi:hypothetical protein
LQKGYEELLAAGIDLYAISYDEPDALADFSAAHGITFPLLSDPDSEIITSFGILNTLIPPDDHPWHGIPFPGTYVIDDAGEITHKFFEHSLAVRVGPEQLLAAVRGEDLSLEPPDPTPVEVVTIDVSIEGRNLPPGIQRDLVVRFSVPSGQHLYAEPVPEGLVAASIELDTTPGLMASEIVKPDTRPLILSGTGDTLNVYDGNVTLRQPITQNGAAGEKIDGQRMITVNGEVRWQACDDARCGLPQRQRFELQIPAGRITLPDIGPAAAKGRAEPMNGAKHMARMIERRRDSGG